ncbi:MAG TPA: hypothetical protein VG873_16125 [Burkholderiales bacterium]|nr:hypothetical protein [Burkholderiales bacterium]
MRIEPALATFLEGGVSIVVASSGALNRPTIARAGGCRVAADRRTVTLFLAEPQAAAVLESFRSGGGIAAVFSQPSTHRTYQLKGPAPIVGPLEPGDVPRIEAYVRAFCAEVARLGYRSEAIRAVVWSAPQDFVSVSFAPAQAFDQTPGPKAGAPLPERA